MTVRPFGPLAVFLLAPLSHAQLQFTEATQAAGLEFDFLWPPEELTHLSSLIGGGGSPGDYDRDGWVDVFIHSGGIQTDKLFLNDQDGTFTERAAQWGLSDVYRGTSANAADYDADGWLDVHVTSIGDMPGIPQVGQHRLYRNQDGQGFVDVAQAAGVALAATVPDGYSSAWGDYDLDGDLDLWVGGWFSNIWDVTGVHEGTRLFRNEGDGTFTDVTLASGIYDDEVKGLSAHFVDMDGDRFPELLVGGDFGTSQYHVNHRDGTFTQNLWYGSQPKVHYAMGTAILDFDRDGDPDWFLNAIDPSWKLVGPDGNHLYVNHGGHVMGLLPTSAGVTGGHWGWGTAAYDYDHDGWTDILHTNGWNVQDPVTGHVWHDDPTVLFLNQGDGTFTEDAMGAGLAHTASGRGLIAFDPDRDGDMDALIVTHLGGSTFFRNDLVGPDTNWLQVRLDTSQHPGIAPHGIGSKVTVRTTSGATQSTWITGGSSFAARSELVAHFGLGADTMLDKLEVAWPDGFFTLYKSVPGNKIIDVPAIPPLTVEPLVPGTVAQIRLEGLKPGEVAIFLYQVTGQLGPGPCPPAIGGHCIDLTDPVVLSYVPADAQGVAVQPITVPAWLPPMQFATQAVVQRGPANVQSAVSNAVISTVQ